MTTIIKLRRDTAANWTSIDPVLALGEPGVETDTLKMKIGDGVSLWSELDYTSSENSVYADSAGSATTAGTVTTNAQPNITSLGTLTGVTSTGTVNLTSASNVSLGPVANVHITGGTSGQVLTTNGSGNLTWTTAASSYGNSNVASYLPTYNGNLLASNLTATAQVIANANISSINSTTGTIVVTGGIGASGNIHSNNQIHSKGNILCEGQTLYVGPSADATGLTEPVLVAFHAGESYIQTVIKNSLSTGSADYTAFADNGSDLQGWISTGFTSSEFNDPDYTITGPGDGYVFADGLSGTGGNLVLGTGITGTKKDIIFTTNGFETSNEFARIDHANNTFHITRTGASLTFPDGSEQTTAYTGGGGGGGYIIPYEVATFVANTQPGFGEIQFANNEGANSAPATAQKLFINESPTNEQSMGTIFQQWTSNSYRGTLSLNNGNDSQATFNISNGRIYFNPETYRGFQAGLNQIWGDDCSVNQLIITNATAPKFYNTDFLVEDDVFHASGLATGNTHVMLNVYGSSQYNPINPADLWNMFTAFVDGVLYDGETLRTDTSDIKAQFYNNTGSFRNQIPTSELFQYFRFTQSSGADYFASATTTTNGAGSGATLRLRVNADSTYVLLGITNAGVGYQVGDILTVAGTDLGGASPTNDLEVTVGTVDGSGSVTAIAYTSGTGVYPWPPNYISDGSDDQYDSGNYINTNLAAEISYANGEPQTDSAAFGGGDYCVMYNQSFFCMVATGVSSSVNELFYSGNLGFDGDGFLNWTGLRSNQNVVANNNALYAYFDSEYLDGELTPTVGVTYNMTLDSAGINLDGFYSYYDNNAEDYFFGSNNSWRVESQNNLYVQSYSDMYIQTRVNQRGISEIGPTININGGDGSPGQKEINAPAGQGGSVNINGGDAGDDDRINSLGNIGGDVNINGGMGTGNLEAGSVNINGGQTESATGIAGNVNITTSAGPNGNGRVTISTSDGNTRNWAFNANGTLTFPGNGYIENPANSSLDPINPNVSTMVFTPDPGYSAQSLVLDPTAPGHIHLRAPGANIDEPSANIFLGGEASSFEIGYYTGSAPEVFIHSNNKTWTFGDSGTLTLAGDIVGKPVGFPFTGTITNITTGNPTVVVTIATNSFGGPSTGQVIIQGVVGTTEANEFWYWQAVEANEFQLFNDAELTIPVDGTSWTAYVSGGTAYSSSYDSVALSTGGLHLIAGSSSWYFEMDGNIRTPGNLAIGSNPDTGGSIISQDNESLTVVGVGVSSSVVTGWAEYTTAPGNIALVSFSNPISGLGNVAISTGNNGGTQYDWKFDNTGVLTVPGEGIINSIDDVVTLKSSNTVSGNSNSVYLGTSGGLGFFDTAISANWLEIFRNGSDPQLATTGNLLIRTDSTNTAPTWTFGANGTLTAPGGISAGNVLGNGHASFTGSFDESQASNAGVYLGYAGGTPRIMLGTGNTSQTFEIDNDGGNLRFYQPGSTKATLTSNGDLSTAGNITATGKIGYANGGTVTQTGTGQGVTLHQLTGTITLAKSSWVANDLEAFVVQCNKVSADDYILAQISGTNSTYFMVSAYYFTGTSFFINVRALDTVSGAPTVKFFIMKAPTS